jgi:plastocyanin
VTLRRLAFPLAGLLGAAIAAVPGIAAGTTPPSTASIKAVDYAWQANGGTTAAATIAAGGTVTISYPQGFSAHNADFGAGPQPSNCTQSAGASSGPVPPLPHRPTTAGWSGTCTFKTAGTYSFHCDLHPFMTATIDVVTSPPPTTSTTTTSTTTTGTTTTGTTTTETATTQTSTSATTTTVTGPPSPEPSTSAATPSGPSTSTPVPGPPEPTVPIHSLPAAADAIAVSPGRHEPTIRGRAKISPAGAGGRLDVYVFAPPRSLGSRAGRWILVGRLAHTGLAAGTVRFSVRLTHSADRALRRRPLTVVVGVIVRSAHAGSAWTLRRLELLSSG